MRAHPAAAGTQIEIVYAHDQPGAVPRPAARQGPRELRRQFLLHPLAVGSPAFARKGDTSTRILLI